MKLIVGLGNRGRIYARNRHNIGFHCLNHFAKIHDIHFDRQQCRARVGFDKTGELLLVKPSTFINLSGESVASLARRYHVAVEDILVICDDLDLPLGKVRLRQNGGPGGHKGMRSIISELGSDEFPRIRVGIGRPADFAGVSITDTDTIVDYVLGDITSREEEILKPAILEVSEAIDCFLQHGMEIAMSRFN